MAQHRHQHMLVGKQGIRWRVTRHGLVAVVRVSRDRQASADSGFVNEWKFSVFIDWPQGSRWYLALLDGAIDDHELRAASVHKSNRSILIPCGGDLNSTKFGHSVRELTYCCCQTGTALRDRILASILAEAFSGRLSSHCRIIRFIPRPSTKFTGAVQRTQMLCRDEMKKARAPVSLPIILKLGFECGHRNSAVGCAT